MHVKEIGYTGTYHLGDHNFEKINCTFHLNQGENEQFALEQAKKVVEDFHNNRPANNFNRETFINQLLPDIKVPDTITIKQERDSTVYQLLKEIKRQVDISLLEKNYSIYLKTYPEIKEEYRLKISQLLGEKIDKQGGPY